jgi:hypothetical protein
MTTIGSVLLAAPGFSVLVASRVGDAGLNVAAGAMTAVTAAGFFWMVRAMRTAIVTKNEEVVRRVVRAELEAFRSEFRAEMSEARKDIDAVAGQTSAAHRRIDGVMQAERDHRA